MGKCSQCTTQRKKILLQNSMYKENHSSKDNIHRKKRDQPYQILRISKDREISYNYFSFTFLNFSEFRTEHLLFL